MLSINIALFEKFGVRTVIMSYYGTTDQSFLLLSQLNRKLREMLDESYEGILNSMINNATCLLINREDEEWKLSLPWNLFKFRICLNSEEITKTFLLYINHINDRKGYYFNQHYMHSRLWIDSLEIDQKYVNILYPSLEILKSIEVIDYINNKFFEAQLKTIKHLNKAEVLTFKEIQLIASIYILITFYSKLMEIRFCYFQWINRRIGMIYT